MKVFSKKAGRLFAVAVAAALSVSAVVGITVSYAEEAHIHTFSDKLSFDEKNHYFEAECCDNLVTGVQAHAYGADGKCTVCGYTAPEAEHVHTFGENWVYDEVNHWHPSACGHAIVSGMARHTFVNGVCGCGYVMPEPEHVHTYESELKYDAKYHWYASTCEHDIVKDMEPHNLVNGICECGYTAVSGEFFVSAGAYEEGLYAEWQADSVSGVTVSYQAAGTSSWTAIDSNLIRMKGTGTVRADAVGLKAGEYNVRVTSGGKTTVVNGLTVTEYDRAGYAHFGAGAGVGAYNNDGTPKANAQIIYVTEETKNTVSVKWGSKTYTGIANILSGSANCPDPLIVRVIGRVAAATWTEKSYSAYLNADDEVTPEIVAAHTLDKDGNQLVLRTYKQDELIASGFNTLDESVYPELIGLSSQLKYDGSEFDSCWNNCSISGASNVTVEGIGTDAELFQWGLTWVSCNSIEVRNLTFDDYTEDACSFEGNTEHYSADDFDCKRFWIHHNKFNEGKNYWDVCNEQDKHEGDGATDLKRLSYVTVSYNHYYKNHKTGLVGSGNTSMTANVTFHHNYYQSCQSRLPMARQANMHMYNNYYLGSTGTNMSLRASAVALLEYCYFENSKYPVTYGDGTSVGALWNCTVVEGGQGSSTKFVKKEGQIEMLDSRTQTITNSNNENCFGGTGFYLDSTLFYFTTDEAVRANAFFIETAQIPEKIPQLAGVHK